MKLAVMQPYVFPYIGYFQLIATVDTFIFYDDVSYIKNGWINRNRILINGKPKYFTIPCTNASTNHHIQDVRHLLDDRKRSKLLKKIKFTYKRAPFFDTVYPLIEQVLNYDNSYISDMAVVSIKRCCDYLGITPIFKKSSETYGNTNLERFERLVDICNQERATTYINAIGGKKLYSKDAFKKEGISLNFLKVGLDEYEQFGDDFVPGLSIIDIMMFNSPEKIQEKLLDSFELI